MATVRSTGGVSDGDAAVRTAEVMAASTPVPWRAALLDAAERADDSGVTWMLVGSAATAVHGAQVEPGDVDILVSAPEAVHRLAAAMPSPPGACGDHDPGTFLSSVELPVLTFADDAWTFGRWLLHGVRVEVACIIEASAGVRLIETEGSEVWGVRTHIRWGSRNIPVVPLEVQVATMLARQQDERLEAALAVLQTSTADVELLRRALADRDLLVTARAHDRLGALLVGGA